MSDINKLVIYTSQEELDARAGNYPNLVNYNPFTKTGETDDGCGHFGSLTFAVVDPNDETPTIPQGDFHNVELIGFPMPEHWRREK